MPPHAADQPLLLPLTGSVYVKGKIANTEQLLVNIGTDYYVEVSTACVARSILKRMHAELGLFVLAWACNAHSYWVSS